MPAPTSPTRIDLLGIGNPVMAARLDFAVLTRSRQGQLSVRGGFGGDVGESNGGANCDSGAPDTRLASANSPGIGPAEPSTRASRSVTSPIPVPIFTDEIFIL